MAGSCPAWESSSKGVVVGFEVELLVQKEIRSKQRCRPGWWKSSRKKAVGTGSGHSLLVTRLLAT
jgi:hypothetical protein